MVWESAILGAFIGVAGVFGLISLALYPLMGRSFLLWNAARTFGFILIALAALPPAPDGGMYRHLGDIGVAISVGCAGLFLASYLEPGLGLRPLRQRLRWAAVLGLAGGLASLWSNTAPITDLLHDILLLLAILVLVVVLVVAIRRGSRAARYQAFAWAPLTVIGVAELCYEIVTGQEYWLWPLAVLVAVMVDFIVTAAGLGDGFMVIKRERDTAIADVREAILASARDPLTGIANRRGLAHRFDDPSAPRPHGIAVIDCDHFKRINDRFGHAIGDDALVAVARSIEGENLFVGRLGGEEFVALIYDQRWTEQAEAARARIAAGVSRLVPQIDFRVTASAGLAPVAGDDTLDSAIKRADRALYAAKDAGRDRSLSLADLEAAASRLALAG